MTKQSKIAIAVVLVLLLGGGLGFTLILSRGFSARDQPSAVEEFIARRLRRIATPRSARRAENPVKPSQEVLADARAHFADHCAACHANDGSGQTEIGQNLYPKAPDMRLAETQSLSDGELFYIIHNGIRFTGMPAWGSGKAEEDEDSWKLVHFIRRLPQMQKDELEQMKKLNPVSRHDLEEEEEKRKFLQGEENEPSPIKHKH
jgi:mono/diheme cytochrome c family protein